MTRGVHKDSAIGSDSDHVTGHTCTTPTAGHTCTHSLLPSDMIMSVVTPADLMFIENSKCDWRRGLHHDLTDSSLDSLMKNGYDSGSVQDCFLA